MCVALHVQIKLCVALHVQIKLCVALHVQINHCVHYVVCPVLQVGTSSGIVVVNELLGSRKVVSLFTKSKNRGNFVALLNVELFDKETRKTSNVRGRGKEKLDPNIIEYAF